MTGSGRIIVLSLAGLVFSLILTAWLMPGGLELQITSVKGCKTLLVLPLKPGERFTIHYYHSVENAPIWEVHSLDEKGRIYIEEERYLKFGAGMGRMPGVGRMARRDPYEVIENMHMPTGDFILRVGSPGVDHTIIWRGVKKNLSAIVPHEAVKFSAKPVSMIYKLWRYIIPHPATPVLRARAKITSHFMHPKGICFAAHPGFKPSLLDPQLQNPRNSSLFLWFRSLSLPAVSDRTNLT